MMMVVMMAVMAVMVMVVVMIPAIVVIVLAVRAVMMMMIMMPPTVMVMVIIAVICAGSPRMSTIGQKTAYIRMTRMSAFARCGHRASLAEGRNGPNPTYAPQQTVITKGSNPRRSSFPCFPGRNKLPDKARA
jgi:hypothetical protein